MKVTGFLLAVGAAAVVMYAAPQVDSHGPTKSAVVRPGDTLWTIASSRVGPGADIRDYIYDVEQLNHLDANGDIQPGQVLQLP